MQDAWQAKTVSWESLRRESAQAEQIRRFSTWLFCGMAAAANELQEADRLA
jgi:hypothetical protein